MEGSTVHVPSVRSFYCLFCQRPNAIPVNDVDRFKGHMEEKHNIVKDHNILFAQHFTDAKENAEIKERVGGEMLRYLDNIGNVEIQKNNTVRNSSKLRRCPFCKEASDKTSFWRHLNIFHKIYFGQEILIASKLLTIGEKYHLIKRVQNKATLRENHQTIWKSEMWTCDSCEKSFKSNERLALHSKNQKCPDCFKCFTKSTILRRHVSVINTMFSKCFKSILKCQECKKVFKEKRYLDKHMIRHSTQKRRSFKCRDCSKAFLSKRIMAIHLKRRRTCTTESFLCTKCHVSFTTKELLKVHKNDFNCQKLVTCENCNNPVGEIRYSMHLLSCKTLYVSLDMICKTCFRCFNDIGQFQSHLTKKHTAGGPLNCKMCDKTFAVDKWVNKHYLKYHYFEYKCKQCSQLFSTKKILRNHMNIHFDNEAFECSRCLKPYGSKSGLIRHSRIYHPQQVDDIVEIKKPKELDEEVRAMIEKNETGWICKKCGKRSTNRFTIKEHIGRIHLKRRPYICSQCGKSFLTRKMLNGHCRIHTGEKPYSCHSCGWAFSNFSTLNSHKLTHLEVKPFKCTKCDHQFLRPRGLKKHMERNHSTGTKKMHGSELVCIA